MEYSGSLFNTIGCVDHHVSLKFANILHRNLGYLLNRIRTYLQPYPEYNMAAPDTSITVPRDDLDDLYDYNVNDTDDVFRDFNANMDAPIHDEQSRTKTAPKTGADLGIDDEVQIIKKRKPIAKLDENR